MVNVVIDLAEVIKDEKVLKASLPHYDVSLITHTDEISLEFLARISAKSFAKYAVLMKTGSTAKKHFPNNSIEVDPSSFSLQKVAKQLAWIFSNNGKDKPTVKTFFIGDPHFSHTNIIRYCNRPWNSGRDANGQLVVTEKDTYNMNEALIANWNSVVTAEDEVYCLGDFALGNRNRIPEFVSRLNGHKFLVLGNHDYFHVDKSQYKGVIDFFYKAGFERVYDRPIIIKDFVILSHEPLQWVKDGSVWLSIYAHVHNQEMYQDFTSNTFCASAERINYTPIEFNEIVKKCQSASK